MRAAQPADAQTLHGAAAAFFYRRRNQILGNGSGAKIVERLRAPRLSTGTAPATWAGAAGAMISSARVTVRPEAV
jgi:hypothetical protein